MVEADLLDAAKLTAAIDGSDFVFHLAANADVRFGTDHPRRDFEQNTVATLNVLEAMRYERRAAHCILVDRIGIRRRYGDPHTGDQSDSGSDLLVRSLQNCCGRLHRGLLRRLRNAVGYIFRFVSILGERYTHGHVFDFYKQLLDHPEVLDVLGDGHQRSRICTCRIASMRCFWRLERCRGSSEHFQSRNGRVLRSERFDLMDLRTPRSEAGRRYSGGNRGWVGDNPFIFLDCTAIRKLGWCPSLTIRQGVERTVAYLQANQQLFGARA